MPIVATLKLEETKLLWTQTTKCYTQLANGDDQPLSQINPENRRGSATISVTNVKTGEKTFHSQPFDFNDEHISTSLKPGENLEDFFDLSDIFQFPSCGVFDLQARYECADKNVESNIVRVEVLPTKPTFLATRVESGNDVFGVWLNNGKIWLTLINTATEPRFVWSKPIATISDEAELFLSFPTKTFSARQYVAWIVGDKLHYVVSNDEQSQSNIIELDADDYEIVPPILENQSSAAEVLMLKKSSSEWQMRVCSLSRTPTFSSELRIGGAAPEWFQTIYRSNGDRYTFVLMPQSREGNQYTKLAMSLWKEQVAPSKPIFLHNLQGILVAADVFLSTDDRIFGAALVKQETKFIIQKWQLDKNDELALIEMPPLSLNEEWKIEHALLRVSGEGIPFMLIKGGPESNWFWLDDAGEIISLGELSSNINLPIDIIFAGNTFPQILYTDETCGFQFYG